LACFVRRLAGCRYAGDCGGDAPHRCRLLASAQSRAAAEHKSVFLTFHASWCGWCTRLDKFIETPEIQPIVNKYFVPVQEHGEKSALNNPGGEELLAKVGGKDSGLPFFAFLDGQGGMIVNSMRPDAGQPSAANIGYPGEPQEIDWFMTMLGRAAPGIASAESSAIEQWLRKHSP
jgi:hypothetical protein